MLGNKTDHRTAVSLEHSNEVQSTCLKEISRLEFVSRETIDYRMLVSLFVGWIVYWETKQCIKGKWETEICLYVLCILLFLYIFMILGITHIADNTVKKQLQMSLKFII